MCKEVCVWVVDGCDGGLEGFVEDVLVVWVLLLMFVGVRVGGVLGYGSREGYDYVIIEICGDRYG